MKIQEIPTEELRRYLRATVAECGPDSEAALILARELARRRRRLSRGKKGEAV